MAHDDHGLKDGRVTDGRHFVIHENRDEMGGIISALLHLTQCLHHNSFSLQLCAKNRTNTTDGMVLNCLIPDAKSSLHCSN